MLAGPSQQSEWGTYGVYQDVAGINGFLREDIATQGEDEDANTKLGNSQEEYEPGQFENMISVRHGSDLGEKR